ncbi:MAG: DUF488 domain-containing protein [Cyclobacteriaceae bacterium]
MIQIKRIYDPWQESDGLRVLVDRLWPRGLTKEKAKLDQWHKNIAPSHDLRKRFHNGALSWAQFSDEYRKQLALNQDLLQELIQWEKDHGRITLLYAVKNTDQNHAQLIKDFLAK